MLNRKKGLGLLAIAALSVLAFAASAQATTLEFLIDKKLALHANVGAEQVGAGFLLVANLNLKLECKKFTIQSGLITSGIAATGVLLYEECEPLTTAGAKITTCHVYVSAGDKKLHVSASAILLPAEFLTTFSLSPAILAEKIKAKILFEGAECTLPEHNEVTGELCLEIHGNDTINPEVLASSTIQGKCKPRATLEGTQQSSGGVKDKLVYGGQTALVDGTVKLGLNSPHDGLALGVSLIP